MQTGLWTYHIQVMTSNSIQILPLFTEPSKLHCKHIFTLSTYYFSKAVKCIVEKQAYRTLTLILLLITPPHPLTMSPFSLVNTFLHSLHCFLSSFHIYQLLSLLLKYYWTLTFGYRKLAMTEMTLHANFSKEVVKVKPVFCW